MTNHSTPPKSLLLRALALWTLLFCNQGAQAQIDAMQRMNDERRAHWMTSLPRTFRKLDQRQPLRVVVLGDSIGNYYAPTLAERYDIKKAWHQLVLDALARRFKYDGVADALAKKTKGAKNDPPVLGINVKNFSRDGACLVQALQPLTTDAFDDKPDLVMLMFGTNDANTGVPLEVYQRELERVVALCKANKTDLFLAAPPLITDGTSVAAYARTRPYAAVVRTVANREKIAFVDMGAELARFKFEDPAADLNAVVKMGVDANYVFEGVVDPLHPNAAGHQVMAQAAWNRLWAIPSREVPVESSAWVTLPKDGNGKAVVALSVKRPAGQTGRVSLKLIPLPFDAAWKAESVTPVSVELTDAEQILQFPFVRRSDVVGNLASGPRATLSFLVEWNGQGGLLDHTGLISPLSVQVPALRAHVRSGAFTIEAQVTSVVKTATTGTVSFTWGKQSQSAPFTISAAGTVPVKATFSFPSEPGNDASFRGPLTIQIKSGEQTVTFFRTLEVVKNLQVDGSRVLARVGGEATAATKPPVLTTTADADKLSFKLELPNVPKPEQLSATARAPMLVAISLDGRGPAAMGKEGYVGGFQFDLPWADGVIPMRRPALGVFGEGYDRTLDPEAIYATIVSDDKGTRTLEFTVPRNYLYLHDWGARRTGQSTFGVNVRLQLTSYTPEFPDGVFDPVNSYAVTNPSYPRTEALGLATLELSAAEAAGWTILVY